MSTAATTLLDQAYAIDEATADAMSFYFFQIRAQRGRGRLDPRDWQTAAADASGDTGKAATLLAWAARAVDAGEPAVFDWDFRNESTAVADLTGAQMVADVAARDSGIITAMADLHDTVESLSARGAIRAVDVREALVDRGYNTNSDGQEPRELLAHPNATKAPAGCVVQWAVLGRTDV